MPVPASRRWLIAALLLAGLVAAALWVRGSAGARSARAARPATEAPELTPKNAKPPTAPTGEPTSVPGAAEKEWRLEVDVRDEDGRSVRSRVYVTNAAGDLLNLEETEPPASLVQVVRGTVNVIVDAADRVPLYYGSLTPPATGARTLVAQVERGPGIEGRLVDDVGAAVTRERAPLTMVVAYPLDPPPGLTNGPGPWRRKWTRFPSCPREDGTFRFDGLPLGRYEIRCDRLDEGFGDRGRGTMPLLQLEPVTASVGDVNVRVVCVRAVQVIVHLVEFDSGAKLGARDAVMSWDAEAAGICVSSASGPMRSELALTVRPGGELTVSVNVEGYLPPEPLRLAVNREPGHQEATLAFRRDAGATSVLELTVLDDVGQPVYPLMVGRPLAGIRRLEDHDGHYTVRLAAGNHTVWLESPSDQYLLFTRDWVPSNLDPEDYATARAYLRTSVDVKVPRNGGRIAREVRMQRAAFIWIRQEPAGAFQGVRVLRGETEMKGATFELYEDKGVAAQVEPGRYAVEGKVGEKIARVEVEAKAAEVAEVWLRADSAK